MIAALLKRMTTVTFLRSFVIILIAEAITIFVASRLLDFNLNRWFQNKAQQAMRISEQVATANDWTLLDKIPLDRESVVGDRYEDKLTGLNQLFRRNEGSVYLVVRRGAEEYDISAGHGPPDDVGKENYWIDRAYASRRSVYSSIPVIDSLGTYLVGYTPIIRSNKVIGLQAAEYDEAPQYDFQSAVRSAFWYSIIPAIGIALVVAYILASMFVEPMEVFRTIEETAQKLKARSPREEQEDPWRLLSDGEKELAELLRQGVESTKDLAAATGLTPYTIDTYFKRIKLNTGYSRMALAVQAAARRSASAEGT